MSDCILFDIDLTLIKTNGAGRHAMDETFSTLYGIAQPTVGIRFDGRTDRAIFSEAIDRNGIVGGEDLYDRIVADYLLRLEGTLVTRGGEVLPGVIAILNALEREGIRPGLATGNFARGAELKLARFGLWERFAAGGFGDGKLVRAEVVREGLAAMGRHLGREITPERCVVLGDTPLDVEAAHAVGARALAVATGSYTVPELQASDAEWVLTDLSDTDLLLEILTS